MTAITPLPRKRDGSLLLPGQSVTLLEQDFSMLTAVPSGVTVTGAGSGGTGAGAINGTAPTAKLRLSASASSDSVAMSLVPLDPSLFQWMWFEVDVVTPSGGYLSPLTLGLEGTGSLRGANWNNLGPTFNSRNADSPLLAELWGGKSGKPRKSRTGLLLIPGRKIIAATYYGDVINAGFFPNLLTDAPLTPKLTASGAVGTGYVDVCWTRLRVGT